MVAIVHDFGGQKRISLLCFDIITILYNTDPETTLLVLISVKEPQLSSVHTLAFLNLILKVLTASSEYAPELEQDIKRAKGIGRESVSSIQGRRSPVGMTKPSSKINMSLTSNISPKKSNTSFVSEQRSIRFPIDGDLDGSVADQEPFTLDKKKNGQQSNKSIKDTKPILSNLSPKKPTFPEKSKSPINNDTSIRSNTSKVKEVSMVKEESQKFKVMQFDFDDEDCTPKIAINRPSSSAGFKQVEEKHRPNSAIGFRQTEEKSDLSKFEEVRKIVE